MYIELVIFNNFAIDVLLIVCTQVIRRKKLYKTRTILASLVGSLIATSYVIVPSWAQIVIKILLAPMLVAIFDKYRSSKIKEYLKTLALFCLLTYSLGGVTYAISHAFNIDVNSYVQLGICALSAVLMIIVVRFIVRKKSGINVKKCDVVIHTSDDNIKVKGLCDSGNLLTDTISGLPIFIMSKEVEDRLNKVDIQGFVSVSTVSGEKSMPIVYFDEIEVDNKIIKAYGALSRCQFDDVDIILQNSMF